MGAGQGLAEGDDQGNQERGSLQAVLVGPGPVTAWQAGLDAGDPVLPFGSSSHPREPAQVKVKQPACGPETTTFLHWLPVLGRAPAGTGRAGAHGGQHPGSLLSGQAATPMHARLCSQSSDSSSVSAHACPGP